MSDLTPIFRWSGEYFGFLTATGFLFDQHGEYVGWADGDSVWNADGTYISERTEENYVLRPPFNPSTAPKRRRPPPEPTTLMVVPPCSTNRAAQEPQPDRVDALTGYA